MMKIIKMDHYGCVACDTEFFITLDADVDYCSVCSGEVEHLEEAEIIVKE